MTSARYILISILTVLLVVAAVLNASQWSIYVILEQFSVDDSYYYHEIARRLWTEGHLSFDGLTTTNGFHLLWVLIQAPVFALPLDAEGWVLAIKYLEMGLYFFAFVMFAMSVERIEIAYFSVPALAFFLMHPAALEGMELGTTIFAVMLSFAILTRCLQSSSWYWFALFGLSLTLCFLARFEYLGFGVAVLTLLFFDRLFLDQKAFDVRGLSAAAAAFLLGVLAYGIFYTLVFDTLLPISGATKSKIFAGPQLQNLVANLSALLDQPRYLIGICFAVLTASYLIGVRIWALIAPKVQLRVAPLDYVMFGLSALAIVRPLYYSATLEPSYVMGNWYYADFYLLGSLALPYFFLKYATARQDNAASSFNISYLVSGFAVLVTPVFIWASHANQRDDVNNTTADWENASYHIAKYLNRNFAALDQYPLILSRDAGVLGYFYEGAVMNIDGLVNSKAYLEARLDGSGETYLMSFDPSYYANAQTLGSDTRIDQHFKNSVSRGRLSQADAEVTFDVLTKDLFTFSEGPLQNAYFLARINPDQDGGFSNPTPIGGVSTGGAALEGKPNLSRFHRNLTLQMDRCPNLDQLHIEYVFQQDFGRVSKAKGHHVPTEMQRENCTFDWIAPLHKASRVDVKISLIKDGAAAESFEFRLNLAD